MNGNNSTNSESMRDSLLTGRIIDLLKQHLIYQKRLRVLGLLAVSVDDEPHDRFLKIEFNAPLDTEEVSFVKSPESPSPPPLTVALDEEVREEEEEERPRTRRKARRPQRQEVKWEEPEDLDDEKIKLENVMDLELEEEQEESVEEPAVLMKHQHQHILPTIAPMPALIPSSDLLFQRVTQQHNQHTHTIVMTTSGQQQQASGTPILFVAQPSHVNAIVNALRAPTILKAIHPAPPPVPPQPPQLQIASVVTCAEPPVAPPVTTSPVPASMGNKRSRSSTNSATTASSGHHHNHHRKAYKCRYCSKVFNRKFCRERHERLHTGVKPYVCSVCQEKFIRLEDKKRHVRINHPDHTSLTSASPPPINIDDLL